MLACVEKNIEIFQNVFISWKYKILLKLKGVQYYILREKLFEHSVLGIQEIYEEYNTLNNLFGILMETVKVSICLFTITHCFNGII